MTSGDDLSGEVSPPPSFSVLPVKCSTFTGELESPGQMVNTKKRLLGGLLDCVILCSW